jgi:nucleoside-diphosphate-sugar epimerase
MRALIGHTGFVGGTLAAQHAFTDQFNSTNIEAIRGREYELVVCAGAPGRKWEANQQPERDRQSLARLADCLSEVAARRVVLISTVDVYPVPRDVDEDTPIDEDAGTPYGRHRLWLERRVRDRFHAHVVRLPGLFGRGLKKNIIFDFLHDNQIAAISPDSVFQFYDMRHLWHDVERIVARDLPLVNIATEPISVRAVAEQVFERRFENPATPAAVRYDFHSKHAASFGSRQPYWYWLPEVIAGMKRFVAEERGR